MPINNLSSWETEEPPILNGVFELKNYYDTRRVFAYFYEGIRYVAAFTIEQAVLNAKNNNKAIIQDLMPWRGITC